MSLTEGIEVHLEYLSMMKEYQPPIYRYHFIQVSELPFGIDLDPKDLVIALIEGLRVPQGHLRRPDLRIIFLVEEDYLLIEYLREGSYLIGNQPRT
jgi:hypothetical protein